MPSQTLNDAAPTLGRARRSAADLLGRAGFETPALDARLLLEGVIGGGADSDPDRVLSQPQQAHFDSVLQRRLAGEPVWRILGEREFWGLTFALSPATLEPRPDSETLVEAALEAMASRRDEPLSILDLGTGTGCLLIALLSEFRQATGLGVDLSDEAVATATRNAARNDVSARARFRQGDWTAGIESRFDLIVSNPPYIAHADIAGLSIEVRDHDPMLALDGGWDGLDPYRGFAETLPALLADGGVIILEIGADQESDVAALMVRSGLRLLESRRDLGGHPRALIFAQD